MSLTVKAYLEREKADPEIRRFAIDHGVSSNFEYFSQKLAQVFPALSGKKFRVFWKDNEDEYIAFDSDEELMLGLGCIEGDIFKVYVKVDKSDDEKSGADNSGEQQGGLHPGVTCDGCEGAICGPRYKCNECPDYDLCEGCEKKGMHKEHTMTCFTSPFEFCFPPFWGRGGHHGRGGRQHGRCGPQGRAGHHGWGGHHGWAGPQGWGGFHGGWGGQNQGKCRNGKRGGWFRKWWEEQMGAANDGQPSTSQQQSGEQTSQGTSNQNEGQFEGAVPQDFLRNVGEQVAAMLDPLGIDVQVDVEHNGQRQKCGQNEQQQKDKPTEGQTNNKEQTTTDQGAGKDVEMQDKESVATGSPPKKAGSSSPDGSGSGDDDWTMLNNHGDGTGGVAKKKSQTPERTTTGANMYPDLPPIEPKIAQAREQMLAMGFNDDGGWMTRLLISTNGDIYKALDALRPGMKA